MWCDNVSHFQVVDHRVTLKILGKKLRVGKQAPPALKTLSMELPTKLSLSPQFLASYCGLTAIWWSVCNVPVCSLWQIHIVNKYPIFPGLQCPWTSWWHEMCCTMMSLATQFQVWQLLQASKGWKVGQTIQTFSVHNLFSCTAALPSVLSLLLLFGGSRPPCNIQGDHEAHFVNHCQGFMMHMLRTLQIWLRLCNTHLKVLIWIMLVLWVCTKFQTDLKYIQ